MPSWLRPPSGELGAVEAALAGCAVAVSCPRCDARWTGLKVEHCSVCHLTFSSTRAGDRHLVDMDPVTGRSRHLTRKQMLGAASRERRAVVRSAGQRLRRIEVIVEPVDQLGFLWCQWPEQAASLRRAAASISFRLSR
jgi:hypothetical protein